MQRRDEEIRQQGERYAQLKQETHVKQEAVLEQQHFLEDQENENKKTEGSIATLERVVAKQRVEFGMIRRSTRQA